MQSKDVLKNALLQYEGSMILVSHDRDFLQGLTEKVFEFKDRHLKTYIGDVYDFLEKKKIDSLNELQHQANNTKEGEKALSAGKENWEKKKEEEAKVRKIQNRIKKIETEIAELTRKLHSIEAKLAQPELYADIIASGELYNDYENIKAKITAHEEEWLTLQS